MKVLILEDDLSVSQTVTIFLQKRGISAMTAQTTENALAAVQCFVPHLVLADWKIKEDVDGVEVCRELLKISPDLSLIFMSSGPLSELKEACADLTPLAILPKSFGSYELVANIVNSMSA